MYNIIIVGAGGCGREVYQWSLVAFNKVSYQIKGFLANDEYELDKYLIDAPILGHEDEYDIQKNDRFIIAIGNVSIKKEVVGKLKDRGAIFLTLLHPTAIISANTKIGEGVVICPYVILADSVEIGDFSMINIYASCSHEAKLGKHCILSPYATLNGGAVLDDDVFVATHATITGSKYVGKGAVIGANSLVLHDIPEYGKVIGVSKRAVAV